MQMSDLAALRVRLLRAAQRGYGVARAEHYAKLLGGSGDETSAAELLALCEAALSGKTAPKPVKAAPKPAPKPAEPEPAAEESAAGYEEWTKKELYAEAEARDIEGRSSMTKAELVAALEADDAG